MTDILLSVGWGLVAMIPAGIAYRKGREMFPWWLFSVFFWPVTLIAAIAIRPKPQALQERAAAGRDDSRLVKRVIMALIVLGVMWLLYSFQTAAPSW